MLKIEYIPGKYIYYFFVDNEYLKYYPGISPVYADNVFLFTGRNKFYFICG